jgi:plasmid stability protein
MRETRAFGIGAWFKCIAVIAVIAYIWKIIIPRNIGVSTLTIRNVDPSVKQRLRVRAARSGRSMEAELRHILSEAVGGERGGEPDLAEAIRRRFQPFGGIDDLEPHPPTPASEPPTFDR